MALGASTISIRSGIFHKDTLSGQLLSNVLPHGILGEAVKPAGVGCALMVTTRTVNIIPPPSQPSACPAMFVVARPSIHFFGVHVSIPKLIPREAFSPGFLELPNVILLYRPSTAIPMVLGDSCPLRVLSCTTSRVFSSMSVLLRAVMSRDTWLACRCIPLLAPAGIFRCPRRSLAPLVLTDCPHSAEGRYLLISAGFGPGFSESASL
ncbi:uncharacterized protein LOC117315386 [Pecten maximus]|uniref:uncharacterized protein LOC117315386 n=1 Tax=Pecten maximus TaxID=6579 RepID=UPI0014580039|nr:uncharacterized protein LOC117315386 [Pecten maximus]